ncbi:MAG: UTP--glucose-1-phosphate uridylyltransferase, partial [Armatimonadota bacterium]|nr:UTP--glucose-1-phosphate uridylyltransferase [Armatimonadota bacterium]
VRRIGALTTRNFFGPIQTIIPWANNYYTETLIQRTQALFGDRFWGFWMLGGMSGGGMGFIFHPEVKEEAQTRLLETMLATKRELQSALPYAMDPVVYDFAINPRGTEASLLEGEDALLPPGYYALVLPPLLRCEPHALSAARRAEIDRFGAACRTRPELSGMVQVLFDRLLPRMKEEDTAGPALSTILQENGFDRAQHEQIRSDLREGRIGMAQNRLPASTSIRDVSHDDVIDATGDIPPALRALGREALAEGAVAVLTLAAGVGSRWTQGAGVVKALHPFCRLCGRYRTFIDVHLAKSHRVSTELHAVVPHVITTSYQTHAAIAAYVGRHPAARTAAEARSGVHLYLSPGRSIGLRLVPMVRDLRFVWEEMAQQTLDEQKQKMRESLQNALIAWARNAGEGSDYTDNVPTQCVHPVGHWYEVPNLLRNGTLHRLLQRYPRLRYLMLHNIDTLGADLDPGLLGLHIHHGACLTFEVISRRIEDRGGGLARVNGRPRLVEGLAMPREEDEFALSYYNSNTTWIDVDRLLAVFGLTRDELAHEEKVSAAVRALAARMPTYITIKDVKKRWGHGQEDVFPVAQFEKLWGDMTALPEVECRFAVVPRLRGQQLKDQAQLDGWLRDGSARYVESLCRFQE